MANKKSSTPKSKKSRVTKYTKLALVCAKELAAKKKALVQAEKRLAKAQQTHQDLLSEVARLDMLDRSLRAINEKTQPPQNIKYVYTYPQWVWNPPYTFTVPNYIPNSGQWTFTTQPSYLQGGLNTPNLGTAIGGSGSLLTNSGTFSPTVTCTLNSGNVQTVNTVTTGSNNGSDLAFHNGDSNIQWVSNAPNDGSFVVDLTTHEPYEESANPRAAEVAEADSFSSVAALNA